MALEAIIFDIDGTLYPNRSMYLHSAGFFLAHLRLIRQFSIVRKDLRKVGRIEHFEETQAAMLAARMNLGHEQAASLIQNVLYERWEKTFRRVKPWKDTEKELRCMADKGLRLGILSDYPIGRKLQYFGLDKLPWELLASSRDSGYLKPSFKPFNYCAEKMNLPPENILYVGNNYQYDVVGARKAGMKTAWITRKTSGRSADLVVKNFKGFSDKVNALI